MQIIAFTLGTHKSPVFDPVATHGHLFHFHWLLFSPAVATGRNIFSERKSLISPNLSPWYFMPPNSSFSPPPALWSPEKQPLFISERGRKKKKSADLPLMWTIWKFGTWEFDFEKAMKRNNSLEMCDLHECDLRWHEWKYCFGRIYCWFCVGI